MWPLVIRAFLLVLIVAGLVVWIDVPNRVRRYIRQRQALKDVPGLPTHWFWGNLQQLSLTEECIRWLHKQTTDGKWPLHCLWNGPFHPFVIIRYPQYVKTVLKTSKSEYVYGILRPWLGNGLLIAEGDQWFRNRRLLTPAFHFDILKPYVYVYNECADILLTKWEKAALHGEVVDVFKDVSKLSLDIILRCAFSFESNCQGNIEDSVYIKSVNSLCELTAMRILSPSLMVLNDTLYMYCTSVGRRYRKAADIVHRHAEKVIRERKILLGIDDSNMKSKNRRKSEVFKVAKASHKYLDFLDVLVTAKDEDGCGLSDEEIRNEVDTFMFEGHDTTANGLMWTLYLLAKHPEYQEKCWEEIDAVLCGKEHMDNDDLPKLQYTTMCIKESLRLYPPVYEVYRVLSEDTVIGGFTIPKETNIVINIWEIHHNPDVWVNPEEFNPLRFDPDQLTDDRHPYAFMPFSAGHRNCIGQNFALNEMKSVISSVLNRFSLSLVQEHEVKMAPLVILKAPNDVKIRLTLRR